MSRPDRVRGVVYFIGSFPSSSNYMSGYGMLKSSVPLPILEVVWNLKQSMHMGFGRNVFALAFICCPDCGLSLGLKHLVFDASRWFVLSRRSRIAVKSMLPHPDASTWIIDILSQVTTVPILKPHDVVDKLCEPVMLHVILLQNSPQVWEWRYTLCKKRLLVASLVKR